MGKIKINKNDWSKFYTKIGENYELYAYELSGNFSDKEIFIYINKLKKNLKLTHDTVFFEKRMIMNEKTGVITERKRIEIFLSGKDANDKFYNKLNLDI